MAGEEEDVELRDLVAQTLESQGVLGSIRAQLRASVVLALEEQESKSKPHALVNSQLSNFLKTKDGQVTVGLVREFLEFFELDFTCSVFDPETSVLRTYQGRDKLAADIGLDPNTDTPLLLNVLKRSQETTPTISTNRPLTTPLVTMETSTPTTTSPLISIDTKPHPLDTSILRPQEQVFSGRNFIPSDQVSGDSLGRLLGNQQSKKELMGGRQEGEESDEDTANLKYDTTDHSLSQTSGTGDYDYTEQIQFN